MGEMPAKIINAITTALVAVVAAFALIIVAGKPFGFHAYAVLSGSMEPAYHTGALIYVKEVKPSTLGQGDVITFMTGKDTTVTHRIVDEVQGEDGVTRFQTQGDANTVPDGGLVHPDNVIGTPVAQIPALGYVVNFIQFPPGTYIAISFCAIIVFLMFLPDLFPSRRDGEGEGEDERAQEPEPKRQRRGLLGRRGGHADEGMPQYENAYTVYAQAAYSAGEYGRQVYAQHPHGQQARPMSQRPQSAGQQMARSMQQSYPGQQRALPAQGQRANDMRPAQQPGAQQMRPLPQRASMQQPHPNQAQPQQVQARPARAQRPAANAAHPAANAAGTNNPRMRTNQTPRFSQNAAQTHPSQAKPARRPVS